MTIKEAWKLLAEKWDNAEQDQSDGTYFVTVGPDYQGMNLNRCIGLCKCVIRLRDSENGLTQDQTDIMTDEIDAEYQRVEHMGKTYGPYIWDFELEGAKSRAAFCRSQIK